MAEQFKGGLEMPRLTVDSEEGILDVHAPDDSASLEGSLTHKNGLLIASIDFVNVPEGSRRRGLGSALVARFALEAADMRAHRLQADATHPSMLRIFERLIGESHMSYYPTSPGTEAATNYSQAMAFVEGMYVFRNTRPTDLLRGMGVEVDLTSIDVAQRIGYEPHTV